MTSNFESGRFDFTSSSHSSRKAISELFDTNSGKFDCCKKSEIASRPRSISVMASANFPWPSRMDALARVFIMRSEEHTSELQSHSDLVCRLLLEKKNRN